jgi:hypothetical protein
MTKVSESSSANAQECEQRTTCRPCHDTSCHQWQWQWQWIRCCPTSRFNEKKNPPGAHFVIADGNLSPIEHRDLGRESMLRCRLRVVNETISGQLGDPSEKAVKSSVRPTGPEGARSVVDPTRPAGPSLSLVRSRPGSHHCVTVIMWSLVVVPNIILAYS